MKVCVLNLSGNVGKSTLAVHLLAAFRPQAKFVSVETFNATNADEVDSIDVQEWEASQFKEIFRELMRNDDVIVDVGASNVGVFMAEMKRFKSSVGQFDLILVPTAPAEKQEKDTISTIEWLHDLGVDRKKIRVILNLCPTSSGASIDTIYPYIVGYGRTDGKNKAVFEPYAVVEVNEIYMMAKESKRTIRELAEDSTDWPAMRAAAKQAGDVVALDAAIEGQIQFDLALLAHENLQQVDALLFGRSKRA